MKEASGMKETDPIIAVKMTKQRLTGVLMRVSMKSVSYICTVQNTKCNVKMSCDSAVQPNGDPRVLSDGSAGYQGRPDFRSGERGSGLRKSRDEMH